MTDQHFADALSSVRGRKYIHTPNLDKLVKNGLNFKKAYTANPLCIPARNSLFTGRYPFETGLQTNKSTPLPSDMQTIGEYFINAGYDTGYFGKWHLNMKTKDVSRHGFQEMGVLQGKGADHLIPEPAIHFMKQKRDKPFLLVTSFTSPHDICEMCRGQKIPSGPIGPFPSPEHCPPSPINLGPSEDETDTIKLIRESYINSKMTPVSNFTPEKWRQMRWGYYRLIERADLQIGKVLNALEDQGLKENTLIVFTADHGDCTGAHGFAQKTVFYDEASRIPLVLSYPKVIQPNVSNELIHVGLDVLPTLLDYAGISKPKELKGLSLRPIAENKNLDSWRESLVISNHMVQRVSVEPNNEVPKPKGRMVRTENFKYSVYDLGNHRESLIDMVNDPHELKNLARNPEYLTVLKKHQLKLMEYAIEVGDVEALEILK